MAETLFQMQVQSSVLITVFLNTVLSVMHYDFYLILFFAFCPSYSYNTWSSALTMLFWVSGGLYVCESDSLLLTFTLFDPVKESMSKRSMHVSLWNHV